MVFNYHFNFIISSVNACGCCRFKISGNKVSWSSNKKSVATVSKWGIVTAKSEGKATITAKYKNIKYTCIVTVNDYSDWVPYNTGGLGTLMEQILKCNVVYINDKDYYKLLKFLSMIFHLLLMMSSYSLKNVCISFYLNHRIPYLVN
ncbi:MAG: Ig-like domain-containing protein [Anaerocolumna sp.]